MGESRVRTLWQPIMLGVSHAQLPPRQRLSSNVHASMPARSPILRCDFFPQCYMASTEVRERRRTLRYRKLLVRQNVQLRNKVSQMLMESGVCVRGFLCPKTRLRAIPLVLKSGWCRT
jgi:hypothetical protein